MKYLNLLILERWENSFDLKETLKISSTIQSKFDNIYFLLSGIWGFQLDTVGGGLQVQAS